MDGCAERRGERRKKVEGSGPVIGFRFGLSIILQWSPTSFFRALVPANQFIRTPAPTNNYLKL